MRIKLAILFLFLPLVVMAQKKISQFPNVTSLASTQLFVVVSSDLSTNQNITWQQITNMLINAGGLTNLNASELRSGTVPDARLSGNVAIYSWDILTNSRSSAATLGTVTITNLTVTTFNVTTQNIGTIVLTNVDGSFWTNLSATELRSGTVAAARLPTTVSTNNGVLTSGRLLAGDGGRGESLTDLTGDVTTSGGVATTLKTSPSITTPIITTPTINGFLDAATNTFTTNTAFPLGWTNLVLTSAANTGCGITGVANNPTSTERWGQLTINATGNVVWTNPASIHASDFLTSRTITNGNTAVIAIDVVPNTSTNMAIVQFR